MVEGINKILLMGKDGFYNFAKKREDGLNLEPDKSRFDSSGLALDARDLIPYGFSFTFGYIKCNFNLGIFGYDNLNYEVERQ